MECCICWEKINNNIVILNCCQNRVYHKSCLLKWLHSNYNCPFCRKIYMIFKKTSYINHNTLDIEFTVPNNNQIHNDNHNIANNFDANTSGNNFDIENDNEGDNQNDNEGDNIFMLIYLRYLLVLSICGVFTSMCILVTKFTLY